MSKGVERLKELLPENTRALAKQAKAGDIPNFSTQKVEENVPFDSHQYEGAFRAQAGSQSTHLELAAASVRGGFEDLNQMRTDLAPLAGQLQKLRLPDTRVNIDGIKMEIPFDLKQYAADLDPETYNAVMFALLGKERMVDFRRHATRANQNHTPALWLNQAVFIETKKPYVWLIERNVGASNVEKLDEALTLKVNEALRTALGNTLWNSVFDIANVNKMPPYAVFVILVDEVLQSRNVQAVPQTAASIWDDPLEGK